MIRSTGVSRLSLALALVFAGACQPPPDEPSGMRSEEITEIHPPDGNCGDLWYTWHGPWGDVPVRSNSGHCDIHGTYGLEYECAELVDRFFLHNLFGDTKGQPQRIWANAGYGSCNYVWDNLRQYYDVYGPKYTHGGPEPIPGDALEWDNGAGSFHTALVVENYQDKNGQKWLGAIQQNAYWNSGTAWPTRNVKWNGTTFSSTWQNLWDGESVCYIHAKANAGVTCGASGAACKKSSDCCNGAACQNGACVACPGAQSGQCTVNGCSGTPSCAVSLDATTPSTVLVRIFNETGAPWPAASTAIGSASGMPSPLSSTAWRSPSVAVGASGDTAPSDAASFVVPLAVASAEGMTSASDRLQVFLDGKPVGAPLTVQVSAHGDGGLDATLDRVNAPEVSPAGSRVQASIELTNSGRVAWRAGRVTLTVVRSDGALRDPSWPAADQAMALAADTAPGASVTLPFWLDLPAGAHGTMNALLQLTDDDAGPFGPTVEVPLLVGAEAPAGGCAIGASRSSPLASLLALALLALALRRRGARG